MNTNKIINCLNYIIEDEDNDFYHNNLRKFYGYNGRIVICLSIMIEGF